MEEHEKRRIEDDASKENDHLFEIETDSSSSVVKKDTSSLVDNIIGTSSCCKMKNIYKPPNGSPTNHSTSNEKQEAVLLKEKIHCFKENLILSSEKRDQMENKGFFFLAFRKLKLIMSFLKQQHQNLVLQDLFSDHCQNALQYP